jgi:hypothetical protein
MGKNPVARPELIEVAARAEMSRHALCHVMVNEG